MESVQHTVAVVHVLHPSLSERCSQNTLCETEGNEVNQLRSISSNYVAYT